MIFKGSRFQKCLPRPLWELSIMKLSVCLSCKLNPRISQRFWAVYYGRRNSILRKLRAITPIRTAPAASIVQSSPPIFFVITSLEYALKTMAMRVRGPNTTVTMKRAICRLSSIGMPSQRSRLTIASSNNDINKHQLWSQEGTPTSLFGVIARQLDAIWERSLDGDVPASWFWMCNDGWILRYAFSNTWQLGVYDIVSFVLQI